MRDSRAALAWTWDRRGRVCAIDVAMTLIAVKKRVSGGEESEEEH